MATRVNYNVDAGATFSQSIVGKTPENETINLTGYSVRGKVKVCYSTGTASEDLTVSICSGDTGEAFISGLIDFSLTATQTSGLLISRLFYDIEAVSGAKVIRVQEGLLDILPEVTR